MFPMDRQATPVTVEYTAHGKRVSKCFATAYKARSFYAAKMRAGAAPKVTAAGDSIMAKNNSTNGTTTVKGTKATKPAKATKPSNGRVPTGNLPLPEARAAFLKALASGRKNRNELKPVAPYLNYTALCRGLVADGLVVEERHEGDSMVHYALATPKTPKGKKPAKAPKA